MTMQRTKTLALHVKAAAAGAPTEEQLAAIRAYTLRDFTADELVVREVLLAHNGIDRDNEVFDEALLADFERTLPGKGVFIRHPGGWNGDGGPGEGRCFGAGIERMSFDEARKLLGDPDLQFPPDRQQAVVLRAQAYFVKTPDNTALLLKMDAGIVADCSIGFCAESYAPIVDGEGRELTARRVMGPGEALEFSFVWLGAQPGARAVKSAHRTEEETMNLEEQLKAAKAEAEQLKAKVADGAKAAAALEAARKALGDDAALIDAPEKLAALVASGKSYRATLVDDIVTGERHMNLIGDTDQAVADAKALYADMPTAKLEALRKHVAARLPAGSRMAGGDPGKGAPGAKQAPQESPVHNPLISGVAAAEA